MNKEIHVLRLLYDSLLVTSDTVKSGSSLPKTIAWLIGPVFYIVKALLRELNRPVLANIHFQFTM